MKTTTSRLTAAERQALRAAIDQAVRARLNPPTRSCPECGADRTDLQGPVIGCETCANRYSLRRRRAARR